MPMPFLVTQWCQRYRVLVARWLLEVRLLPTNGQIFRAFFIHTFARLVQKLTKPLDLTCPTVV